MSARCGVPVTIDNFMDRIFHKRVGVRDFVVVAVFAIVGLWAFMHRNVQSGLVGLAMMMLAALTVERAVHTIYTLTADGRLLIDCGRFARRREVSLTDIRSVYRVEGRLLLRSYVAVECASGSVIAVQPGNEEGFVKELRRRMESARQSSVQDAAQD